MNPLPILHLDMDAFFAAVEVLDHPELRGKPLLIGHDGPRGVVSTASYEARKFGCHSAQPMSVAKRLCPQAIILPNRGERYYEISSQMFAILEEYTPLVEPLSVDEAFLDLTGTEALWGSSIEVGEVLRSRIRSELHLTASVGVAPNKFLAKLASDMNKPDGMMVIRTEEIDTILPPLPVTKIWGIGKATAAEMERFGIRTIGDLRAKSEHWLQQHFGAEADRYYRLSRGIDSRQVTGDREAKSIGHEQTFEVDIDNADAVRQILLNEVEQVAQRLRRHQLLARGISIKIRYGHFQTVNRSLTFSAPTDATDEIWQAALKLFSQWSFQPVRLIGITVERLGNQPDQLNLFADPQHERLRKLDQVTDKINLKFGNRSIRRGGS